MPRVSIGMPIYTRTDFLEMAIRSLVAQTFRDWELLISDDASPHPEVQKICRRYSSTDSRIRYVRQPRNLGGPQNHVHVFKHTEAPLFMWADEDDLWEPTFIERGVAALDADPTKGAWFCQPDKIDERGNVIEILPPFARLASAGKKRQEVARFLLEPERFGRVNLFYSIFRREALAEAIPVQEEFIDVNGSDQLFVYSFICRHDVAISNETLFHKRTSARVVRQRWRHANLFNNRHFRGYYLAAAGTPYQRLTGLLLLPRFILDRAYKLRRLLPGSRRRFLVEPSTNG
jgi:glycosyltransferase involved in cell wall biosynthesis